MATPTSSLSFDRAEYPGDPAPPDQCAFCHRRILDAYFRVADNMACPTCAENAASLIPPDSRAAYSRGLLFGAVAAAVACVVFSVFQMWFMIGYVAVGVGWLVAKGMTAGSRGRGGRRYQVTAAILTYVAISMSFIPLLYRAIDTNKENPPATATPAASAAPANSSAASPSATTPSPAASAPAASPVKEPVRASSFFLALLIVFGLGLVSPFVKFFFSVELGLFGLLWLFLGIQTAWRMTAAPALVVDGPFHTEPKPARALVP